MSKDVRDVAIEKGNSVPVFGSPFTARERPNVLIVHRIVQKIGYPTRSPDLLNATAIQKYYEGVQISNDRYFANALAIAKFDSDREWSKLGKPTNRDEWLMTAVAVNVSYFGCFWRQELIKIQAYYNPPGNEIVFPAGIMQPPIFYDPSLPSYISYGPFGSISGHELTHGLWMSLRGLRHVTDVNSF